MGNKLGHTVAIGKNNTFSGSSTNFEEASLNERTLGTYGAFAVGLDNTIYSKYGVAIGYNNTVSGNNHTFAQGDGHSVMASNGVCFGEDNTISGSTGSFTAGSGNTTSLYANFAVGEGNTVGDGSGFPSYGRSAAAIGRNSTIIADYGFGVGYGHSVSGASTGTMALGLLNVADENSYCSTLLGYGAKSSRYAEVVHAATAFSTTGDAQVCHLISKNQTTDATETELFTNGSTTRITIPANTNATFSVLIIARQTNGAGEGGSYKLEGAISNEGGTTSLIGSVTKTVLAEDVAAWDVAATADDTNDALKLTGTGAASDNVNWVAYTTLVQTTG